MSEKTSSRTLAEMFGIKPGYRTALMVGATAVFIVVALAVIGYLTHKILLTDDRINFSDYTLILILGACMLMSAISSTARPHRFLRMQHSDAVTKLVGLLEDTRTLMTVVSDT